MKSCCFQEMKNQLQDIEAMGQAKQSCFFLVLRTAQLPDVSIFRSGSVSLYTFSIGGLALGDGSTSYQAHVHINMWPKATGGLGLHRSKPKEVREPEKSYKEILIPPASLVVEGPVEAPQTRGTQTRPQTHCRFIT